MVYGFSRFLSLAAEVKSQCFGGFLNFSKTNQFRKFEEKNCSTILLIPYYKITIFSYKITSIQRKQNFSNMNSDFASAATDRNLEIPYTIFVVSEQVLDASG